MNIIMKGIKAMNGRLNTTINNYTEYSMNNYSTDMSELKKPLIWQQTRFMYMQA